MKLIPSTLVWLSLTNSEPLQGSIQGRYGQWLVIRDRTGTDHILKINDIIHVEEVAERVD
jgi:hypothetical protein